MILQAIVNKWWMGEKPEGLREKRNKTKKAKMKKKAKEQRLLKKSLRSGLIS